LLNFVTRVQLFEFFIILHYLYRFTKMLFQFIKTPLKFWSLHI